MGVDYSEDMMSELIKDISIDSRVDLFKEENEERRLELLQYVEDVPPFIMVDYQLTRHVIHTQTVIEKQEKKVELPKPFRRPEALSQYRSFINDPVHRIAYYKELWAKDKVVSSMGKVLKEDYKILYKK